METKRLEYRRQSKYYSVTTATIFVIFAKHTGEEVGEIIIANTGEITYEIELEYAGRGYATEALGFAKKFAEDKGLKPFLRIRPKNEASKKVARRNSFKRVSLFEKFEIWRCDEVEMG